MEKQSFLFRNGFKQPQEYDVEDVLSKQGSVADVVSEFRNDDQSIRPGEFDVELSLGGQERALNLSDQWSKVASLIEATEEDVELAVAPHIDGGART